MRPGGDGTSAGICVSGVDRAGDEAGAVQRTHEVDAEAVGEVDVEEGAVFVRDVLRSFRDLDQNVLFPSPVDDFRVSGHLPFDLIDVELRRFGGNQRDRQRGQSGQRGLLECSEHGCFPFCCLLCLQSR